MIEGLTQGSQQSVHLDVEPEVPLAFDVLGVAIFEVSMPLDSSTDSTTAFERADLDDTFLRRPVMLPHDWANSLNLDEASLGSGLSSMLPNPTA